MVEWKRDKEENQAACESVLNCPVLDRETSSLLLCQVIFIDFALVIKDEANKAAVI